MQQELVFLGHPAGWAGLVWKNLVLSQGLQELGPHNQRLQVSNHRQSPARLLCPPEAVLGLMANIDEKEFVFTFDSS